LRPRVTPAYCRYRFPGKQQAPTHRGIYIASVELAIYTLLTGPITREFSSICGCRINNVTKRTRLRAARIDCRDVGRLRDKRLSAKSGNTAGRNLSQKLSAVIGLIH